MKKQKNFKGENLEEDIREVEMVKYKRVKGHSKTICDTKGKCKRVYVRPHLRKIVKKKK